MVGFEEYKVRLCGWFGRVLDEVVWLVWTLRSFEADPAHVSAHKCCKVLMCHTSAGAGECH